MFTRFINRLVTIMIDSCLRGVTAAMISWEDTYIVQTVELGGVNYRDFCRDPDGVPNNRWVQSVRSLWLLDANLLFIIFAFIFAVCLWSSLSASIPHTAYCITTTRKTIILDIWPPCGVFLFPKRALVNTSLVFRRLCIGLQFGP